MDKSKAHKIPTAAGIILVVVALIADLLTLIPFAGDFVSPIFWVAVSIYFWKRGMGIVTGKQGVAKIISFIAEFFPGIQALPTIFLAMLVIVGVTRFEEKTGLPISSMAGGKPGTKMNVAGSRLPTPKVPLNQGGIRPPNGGLPA